MKRNANLCSLLALGAVLGLAGCGGSGSGNSTPVVNSTPPPVADPGPAGEAVTIMGQVTDRPIANARVVVTVGDQQFEADATTDDQGNFSVEIRSDDPGALVLMEAFDPATGVHFTALLDDFGGFRDAAGEDGVVTEQDITNVTTAHYVLAVEASDDGSIDDLEELDETAERVDVHAVLELSAAIKLVVENIDGVTLPAEFADTQELAEAILDGTTTFLEDVATMAPSALDDAVELVLSDGNATLEFDAAHVPGVYVHREGAALFTMYADGTGLAANFERDTVASFQWTVNDAGKLLVAWQDGSGEEIVTLLSRQRNILQVVAAERNSDGTAARGEPSTVRYFPFAERSFTNENVPGTYSTLDEPGRVKVMLPDHTGYDLDLLSGVQLDGFTWEVAADGTLYIVAADGTLLHKARVLGGAADGGLHLLVSEHDSTGRVAHLDVITVRHIDEVATASDPTTDADLRLAGLTYAALGDGEIAMFRFRADGELRELSQRDTSTGVEYRERAGEWMMIDDQTLRTRFADDDMPEDVRLIDGVGAATMIVQTPEDIATDRRREATRVERIDADSMTGVFYIIDEAGAIGNEYVQLDADGSGQHYLDGVVDQHFEWSVNEHGSLVVELLDAETFGQRTITLHLLAGGNAAEMRFIAVHRYNGRLDGEGEGDRALSVVDFWREG